MPGPGGGVGRKLLSDLALDTFAQPVPEEIFTQPDQVVLRGTLGLVMVDGEWMVMEKVAPDQVDPWKMNK